MTAISRRSLFRFLTGAAAAFVVPRFWARIIAAARGKYAGEIPGASYSVVFTSGMPPDATARVRFVETGPIIKATIGQYADYCAEWDGMWEAGPGCVERLDARLKAAGIQSPYSEVHRA